MRALSDDRMRVLICGSRTWRDGGPIQAVLRQYAAVGPTVLIHGAAKGADSLAEYHGRRLGMEVIPFPALWPEHDDDWCPGDWCRERSYCVAAGPRRNQRMLDEGLPSVVWAFTDKPLGKSKGTKDMVDRARTSRVHCLVVESISPY